MGDWGLGIGDWGLGIGPNPQSPIPNPQSPIPSPQYWKFLNIVNKIFILKLSKKKLLIYLFQKNYSYEIILFSSFLKLDKESKQSKLPLVEISLINSFFCFISFRLLTFSCHLSFLSVSIPIIISSI